MNIREKVLAIIFLCISIYIVLGTQRINQNNSTNEL